MATVGATDAELALKRKEDAADPLELEVIEQLENTPTPEEFQTLRRVPGSLPFIAYLICLAEFAERASYYGVQPLIANFVNRPLPQGGNGAGAPPQGTQETAGALGDGLAVANAVSQSFSVLCYVLPILFGWIADKYTGRFKIVCWGVVVFGIAHALMVGAGAPKLLDDGQSVGPYLLSVYVLAVGAGMFKPNISPLLLDQMRNRDPEVKTLNTGERVIVDPEATTERAMLWFYFVINVGGFMNVPTAYLEKYIGWWVAFFIPLVLYLPLPFLLWFLYKRLVLYPPGGSDLGNVFRVLGICLRRAGLRGFGRKGFWEHAKPSVIAASGEPVPVFWNDEFVNDVRRTFQAAGIFCFFPIQYLNDNGLGATANGLSTMLTTNGVPNDVISNFNTLCIILVSPILNYAIYPLLRKWHIKFGPIRRITFGLALSTVGGVGYTVLNYYAYQQSPCGDYGSSDCTIGTGVAPITIWWMAIPYGIGGISELFVYVPAFGIAYSRAPKNMRGFLSALNLFSIGFAYIIGLACTAVVQDPYLTWDFGAPTIIGAVATVAFWFTFRHLDHEEYTLSKNDGYETAMQQQAADEHIDPAHRQPSVVVEAVREHTEHHGAANEKHAEADVKDKETSSN